MEDIIEDYLNEHINEPMSDVLQGLEETLQSRTSDRRFKLIRMSFSSNGSGTSYSGMFSFHGAKYYIDVIQPWAACQNGSVIAEKLN